MNGQTLSQNPCKWGKSHRDKVLAILSVFETTSLFKVCFVQWLKEIKIKTDFAIQKKVKHWFYVQFVSWTHETINAWVHHSSDVKHHQV